MTSKITTSKKKIVKKKKSIEDFREERIKNKPWRRIKRLFYKGNYMKFDHCNHDILGIEPNVLKIYRSGQSNQPFYSWLVCSICDKGKLFSDSSLEEKFTITPQSIITNLPELGIIIKDKPNQPYFDNIQEAIDYLSLSPLIESEKILDRLLKKSEKEKSEFVKNEIDYFMGGLLIKNSHSGDILNCLAQFKSVK
jgi:hypothetical protein